MKTLKHIINSVIWTLFGLYLLLVALIHLPAVQGFLGSRVADALARKFGTTVSVGAVNLGGLNRIIVDNVMMLDQKGDSMLFASRVSAKIDFLPLMDGKISIASAQLFGMRANLYRQTAQSKPNFQFVLDSLASKDPTSHSPLNLHIGSLIIRRSAVSYNQRDIAHTPGRFSTRHIGVSDLSGHFILNRLTDDDINLTVKRLTLKDKSSLQVKSLSFKLQANKQQAWLKGFDLQLPHSQLVLGPVHASYRTEQGSLVAASLQYEGSIEPSSITLSDIAPLLPLFSHFSEPLLLSSRFSGTSTSLRCQALNIKTAGGDISLQARGRISDWNSRPAWSADIQNLSLSQKSIQLVAANLGRNISVPKEAERLGSIHYKGNGRGRDGRIEIRGTLQTEAGEATLCLAKNGAQLKGSIDTRGINLGRILDNKNLGQLAASLQAEGTKDNLKARGTVSRFDYQNYSFRGITFDGSLAAGLLKGSAAISDPNMALNISGDYHTRTRKYDISAQLQHLKPAILGIKMADKSYTIDDIELSANNKNQDSYIDIEAPFANLHTRGQYNLSTLKASIENLIADKLPSLPGISRTSQQGDNDFTLQANIYSTEILEKMLGIPVAISSPIHVNGNVAERHGQLSLLVNIPMLSYKGKAYHGGNIDLSTQGQALVLNAGIMQGLPYEQAPSYQLSASAQNDQLSATLNYDNHSSKLPVSGQFNAETQFGRGDKGQTLVSARVMPSQVMLGDTRWNVLPATIEYSKNSLTVNHFAVEHDAQHIIINGRATPNREDSIVADLKDVDVAYIMNLINFHSVDFAGRATGQAVVKSIFQDPDAYANLSVADFLFEDGPLGTLHAYVNYNKAESQIDIAATADGGPSHQTLINGYVSPKRNYIDLGIEARGTNMKFMESFCGSFADQVEASAQGSMHVVGPLNAINLVGDARVTGSLHMKQLGTTYHFTNLAAHAIPDDIQIENGSIQDRDGHEAFINGGIHHKHLSRLSYDLTLQAHNFLGYDTHEFGDNTFYGTVYATGSVGIHGKSGETVIDIDARPEPGSLFVYNVAGPESISDKSFIHWHDATPEWQKPYSPTAKAESGSNDDDDDDISSDMHINFLINTNPNLTVKLLMDEQTGDYINLNGSGVIRANYFNKGSFDMFGNYLVQSGLYKLTIQNIIKKDFEFQPGGTISFGGNPYKAPLNLQAKYIVNGVPLSDLNIGRSFTSNNIRVDCLMNIKGTPSAPTVDFTMDLPTVGNDAKQMIYSVINSQEEMNQQVLYLLAIGRFYAQTKNNQASEDATQQSQASLAMQSFLSGTVSQQINTALSSFIKSSNWNFGANISTGDEGFNNAEYEGILSGRLLNNRLLFNGQFGYRDNANATQSFIGDFDLRYLIYPNGNLAVRMYNQTNDRYFTKNSLNTQGIGFVVKRDFNGLGDLLGVKKKKKKKKKK